MYSSLGADRDHHHHNQDSEHLSPQNVPSVPDGWHPYPQATTGLISISIHKFACLKKNHYTGIFFCICFWESLTLLHVSEDYSFFPFHVQPLFYFRLNNIILIIQNTQGVGINSSLPYWVSKYCTHIRSWAYTLQYVYVCLDHIILFIHTILVGYYIYHKTYTKHRKFKGRQ